ncbi:fibronectin type III domain-containing protein, partial [Mesoaciditoga sp.]
MKFKIVGLVVSFLILVLLLSGCFLFPKIKSPLLLSPSNKATNVSINTFLQWSDPNPNPSIDSYTVYFGTSKKPHFYRITDKTRILLRNLKYSTVYYWQVAITRKSGNIVKSEVWHFKTMSLPTPSTPVLRATSISTDTITLQWTQSDHASSITIYQATSDVFSPKVTLTGIATSYIVKNLIPNTVYKYFVVASNPFGKATSDIISAKTLKVVIKPAAPEFFVNSPNTYSVVLTWTEASTNVAGFHIWRRSNSHESYILVASVNGSSASYRDIVEPGHTYSYMVSAYNSAGQSFSNSKSIFVGQDYFPMKTTNSLVDVNSKPSISQSKSVKSAETKSISLFGFVKSAVAGVLSNKLISVNEVISYQKSVSNGATIYTINIPCAFSGDPSIDIKISFQIKNGKIYIQNFSSSPILLMNSVYGEKPSSSQINVGTYRKSATYISEMTIGNHSYRNVYKVTLANSSIKIIFYFVPQEGLIKFEISVNDSTAFSYTVISTSTTLPNIYPQTPVISNPLNNSTVSSMFTLKFTGDSSTYKVYLNSQLLVSTSATMVKVGPLTDGDYILAVKAENSYGLETLSNAVNFTIKGGWVATPTYVVGDFTNWATNSNYLMTYDPVKNIYLFNANIPTPASTLTYRTNRYMIEQVYKGKVIKYGYQPIPVSSGNVTFHFNESMVKPFTSLGIGDSSKASQNWYFSGDFTNWKFNKMNNKGNGVFKVTISTSKVFQPGTYNFKITPQAAFATSPASLVPYYFNGAYGAYYLANGKIQLATQANSMTIEFNTINSQVKIINATMSVPSAYVGGNFNGWSGSNSSYKMTYDPSKGLYTLTKTLSASEEQEQYEYKIVYNGKWYGGPSGVNIPVESGTTVTFYFNPSIATDPNKAIGVGDTSKESMTWYYAGDLGNTWSTPMKMTYIGNGTFAATITGNFSVGNHYGFKITPNDNWAYSLYYYNNTRWGNGQGSNPDVTPGYLYLSTSASVVVVYFDVLNSYVWLKPVSGANIGYYVAGNFNGWKNVVGNSAYKMTKNASGIYTLTTTLSATIGQYMYKVIGYTGTQVIWYGGPGS